jgi:hypothetical protein
MPFVLLFTEIVTGTANCDQDTRHLHCEFENAPFFRGTYWIRTSDFLRVRQAL